MGGSQSKQNNSRSNSRDSGSGSNRNSRTTNLTNINSNINSNSFDPNDYIQYQQNNVVQNKKCQVSFDYYEPEP